MTEIYAPDRFAERLLVRWAPGDVVALDRFGAVEACASPLFPADCVWSGHDARDAELDRVHERAYDEGLAPAGETS